VPLRGSPNLARRRRLAVELRRIREQIGLTADEATERLGWPSNSKLSRIELGRSGVKKADLQALLELYDVTGARRTELTALAEESRKSGRIQAASMKLPEEHMRLFTAEADAETIRIWEPQTIPGLFQTEDYYRILLQEWVTRFSLPSGEIDRRVEARQMRQQILTRDPPVNLFAVIDESVLNRRVGNASIMRTQLQHLTAISRLPNVEIRILPLDGDHFVTTGAFNYLSFRQIHDVPLNDTVVLDHLTGMDEIVAENDIHQYNVVFRSLMESAFSLGRSRALIAGVTKRFTRLVSVW
jgi:transcriptional regulator with XRE-family HTH domain